MALNPLVSLIGRLVARSGRKRGNRQTDRQNDKTTTVTLAAHARRGLITTSCAIKGHDHNVSAYSRRSVNAWGVVNFASTVCILSRAVNFSLLAGPNSSEQKPNQTNKRLVCSYTAQRQQQKLGSCYFELLCNGLSSIMTRTVAYTSTLTYLTLALLMRAKGLKEWRT